MPRLATMAPNAGPARHGSASIPRRRVVIRGRIVRPRGVGAEVSARADAAGFTIKQAPRVPGQGMLQAPANGRKQARATRPNSGRCNAARAAVRSAAASMQGVQLKQLQAFATVDSAFRSFQEGASRCRSSAGTLIELGSPTTS